MQIVPAGPEDFDALRALHRQTMFAHVDRAVGWDEEQQLRRLRKHFNPECLRFVLMHGRRIGCYSLEDRGDDFLLSQFYIAPSHQGRGLGSMVLIRILRMAEWAKKPVRLSVLKGSPALRLYERFGFLHERDDPYQHHCVWKPAGRIDGHGRGRVSPASSYPDGDEAGHAGVQPC
jgi:GNAT superfamily N-acetyltransferase